MVTALRQKLMYSLCMYQIDIKHLVIVGQAGYLNLTVGIMAFHHRHQILLKKDKKFVMPYHEKQSKASSDMSFIQIEQMHISS